MQSPLVITVGTSEEPLCAASLYADRALTPLLESCILRAFDTRTPVPINPAPPKIRLPELARVREFS